MNYYRYFYGQNNANGSMPESDMVQPIEMTANAGTTSPADDSGTAGVSWGTMTPDMPDGGIEPPILDGRTTTPEMPGGRIEPPILDEGTMIPDFSGEAIERPIIGGGTPPPDFLGGVIERPILGGGTTTPDFSGGGIEPPIGGGMRPPIGNLPNLGIVPQVGLMPNFAPNTVQYTLRNCMNNLVYLRTKKGEVFWYYPTRMDFNKVYGYRWGWQSGWFSYDMSYSDIWSAYCYIS